MSVGAVSDPEAVMAAVDRFEAAKPNSHHPRLFAHWSQITQPLTIKMMGAGSRETVTPGSEGARRCDPSGPPDPENYLLPDEDDEE